MIKMQRVILFALDKDVNTLHRKHSVIEDLKENLSLAGKTKTKELN